MAYQPPAPYTPANFLDAVRENMLPPAQPTEKLFPAPLAIAGARWNQAFPYQLIVVERTGDGVYVPKAASGGRSWTFSLPIPPESVSIQMPFAITTSVTLGGYIEEHGGAPVRMITLSGSTGVLPGRSEAGPPALQGTAAEIFGGTIQAASDTAAAVKAIGQNQGFVTNTVADSEFDAGGDLETLTGYYQMRLLQLFLEAYSELKRTKDGRNSRLAFATWKEEQVWLVAPQQFEVHKSAASPFEYLYTLALKANKRIKISTGAADTLQPYVPIQQDPGKLAHLLTTVAQVRTVVQDASATIAAVGGDVHNGLYEPMRELSLFAKDALSIPLMVADLPDSIAQNMKGAVLDLMSAPGAAARIVTNGVSAVADAVADLLDLAAEQADDPSGLQSRAAHPANDPFLSPSDSYGLFSGIQVGDLHLSPAITAAIATERNRVRNLTGNDFQKRRDAVEQTSAAFANAIGMGNDTFNAIYGVQAGALSIAKPTDEDFDVVFALNDFVLEMNRLVVNTNNDLQPKLDAISTVAGMAARSGIAFTIPKSKYAVPFPYGSTMEQLAARYLGDPLRWHEIVALNGLRAPYVDEEGFSLPLLVNGANNTVMVEDASQLSTGQPVWIGSRGATRTRRRITKIVHLSASQHLVTVDGPADLDQYTVLANAMLQAYLPDTVNSQMIIYIPSDIEPKDDEDFRTRAIPGIDSYDPLLQVGGIDFLLTQDNDLVVTPDGDNKWAVGLTNIVQKVRLVLSVRQGTLLGHPQYGLPIAVGTSVADLSASDIARATQDLFAGDPTFTGVKGATVNIKGPTAKLGISVQVAGTTQVIPIGLDVSQ